MPNQANITSPLLIIGAGRSGTSWLMNLFLAHPGVQVAIDNTLAGVVYRDAYNSWWSPELLRECGGDADQRENLVQSCIREVILSMFESPASHWVTKAIWDGTKDSFGGMPNEFRRKLFPDARYIHFARSPQTAIPSIMEYFKDDGHFETVDRAEEAYCSAHEDALRMRDLGVPYLLVRQEEICADPGKVWKAIEDFAGLEPYAFPESLLIGEVNQSSSMIGKVRLGREGLSWDQLGAQTHGMARQLGYSIPENVKPAVAAEIKEEPSEEKPDLSRTIERLAREKYNLERMALRLTEEIKTFSAKSDESPAAVASPKSREPQSAEPTILERLRRWFR